MNDPTETTSPFITKLSFDPTSRLNVFAIFELPDETGEQGVDPPELGTTVHDHEGAVGEEERNPRIESDTITPTPAEGPELETTTVKVMAGDDNTKVELDTEVVIERSD